MRRLVPLTSRLMRQRSRFQRGKAEHVKVSRE